MKYVSTRGAIGTENDVSSMYAIKTGLACDSGLFLPESVPALTLDDIARLSKLEYSERASEILALFLDDYDKEYLKDSCRRAYGKSKFGDHAAPIHSLDGNRHILELWHGPTCAFKDMALQIMPYLLTGALRGTDEKRSAYILVATSGDTGKAALEGYKDIDKIEMTVFYPENGVSRVQKLQMATQTGKNVHVCAIKGNFDDAQNGVKHIFADREFAKMLDGAGYFLSSANSINWGRLSPQIVYYISAYADLVAQNKIRLGEVINVTVPTGNFGNILAAYYAKLMGLPLGKLVCASNSNNVLTDFINTGVYDRNRHFYTTMSPSMDILISSNLERLLYLFCGAEETAGYMRSLAECGKYKVSESCLAKLQENFAAYYADEEATANTIAECYKNENYLIDTHTAVGLKAADEYIRTSDDRRPMLVASTASPYKFAADVLRAVSGREASGSLEALVELEAYTKVKMPEPLAGIGEREVRFTDCIDREAMEAYTAIAIGITK